MQDDERSHLLELKDVQQKRLRALEQTAAVYGIDCPPHITIEIEDIQGIISSIKKRLEQSNEAKEALVSRKSKAKVLVVDDEAGITELLSELLEESDFEVLIASNGRDAINTAVREIPDVILLDINLGDINGYTVLLRISQLKIPTRIIMMTGHHRPGTGMAIASIKSGACSYLPKSLDIGELVEKVQQVLTLSATTEATINNPILAIGSLMTEIDHLIDELYIERNKDSAFRDENIRLGREEEHLRITTRNLLSQLNKERQDNQVLRQTIWQLKEELNKSKQSD